MIVGTSDQEESKGRVTLQERETRFGQKAVTITLSPEQLATAHELERRLFNLGHAVLVLDDTSLAAHADVIARELNRAGLICLCVVGQEAKLDPSAMQAPAELNSADDLLEWMTREGVLLT